MNRLVFLLEEDSMRILLEGLLPKLFPELLFQCVPHDGKQDLEKSIPRKLKAWREPGTTIAKRSNRSDIEKAYCLTANRAVSTFDGKQYLVQITAKERYKWPNYLRRY